MLPLHHIVFSTSYLPIYGPDCSSWSSMQMVTIRVGESVVAACRRTKLTACVRCFLGFEALPPQMNPPVNSLLLYGPTRRGQ